MLRHYFLMQKRKQSKFFVPTLLFAVYSYLAESIAVKNIFVKPLYCITLWIVNLVVEQQVGYILVVSPC